MTPIERLKAEIAELDKQHDNALGRASAYVGSGEDAFTDPDVEEAYKEADRLRDLIEQKRIELKKLGGDPYEGFVGATPADK